MRLKQTSRAKGFGYTPEKIRLTNPLQKTNTSSSGEVLKKILEQGGSGCLDKCVFDDEKRGTIYEQPGNGLKLAGRGAMMSAGSGGGGGVDKIPITGINSDGNQKTELPGVKLRKAMLKNMIGKKSKDVAPMGDRVNPSSVSNSGYMGGKGTLQGKGVLKGKGKLTGHISMDKNFEDSKGYVMTDPPEDLGDMTGKGTLKGKGLKLAGKGKNNVIKSLQKGLVANLKDQGYLKKSFKNSKKVKELIKKRYDKFSKDVKDPIEVSKQVILSMKPFFVKDMSGTGCCKVCDKTVGKQQHGGAIIASIAAIIGAVSAAASAILATTIAGTSVTIGSLVASTLTAAAPIIGQRLAGKKGGALSGIKLKLSDFSKKEQEAIKKWHDNYKKSPTKTKLKNFAKGISGVALKVIKKKAGMSGRGKGDNDFKEQFVKEFTKLV